jgi:hypothetical protein
MKTSHKSSPRSPSRSHSLSMSPNQNGGGDTDSSPLQPTAARSPLPWFTESYFSSEPATSAARKIYIIILASKGLLIIVFLLSVLSIYWGALWQTPAHAHNLNNWVVVSPTSQDFWMRDVNACKYWFAASDCFCFRTLMVVRWASSSHAQWSQVAGRQLHFRGTKYPQIYFQTGCPTSRTRSYRRKLGLSSPVRRQLLCGV